ncbi:hypothetical protein DQ384_00555 [Sphaerisporangium album]|uniref:FtsK domain-containing protein n=1 Tax=Sphaerisporangium album TaxID=509200 RepID=A0A367FRR8_9ACTN|nr:hypothetical protein [Sphaerisporangium album]RCG32981.1 hypothetical protein DQ384_00555 [Sphaerisporangium album]
MTTAKHSKKTSTSGAGRLDWSLAPRGPVSAAGMGTLALAAAAAFGDVADVAPFWPVAAATVGCAGAIVQAHKRNLAPSALFYRLGCWAGAGGWLTWGLTASTPWTRESMLTLGVGALGSVVFHSLAHRTRPRPSVAGGQTRTGVLLRRDAVIAEQWQARFFRVCKARIEVTDVKHWPGGGGLTLTCLLPLQGAGGQTPTRSLVAMRADALATDAQLPAGCGVEVLPGAHRGEFLLKVATKNRLHESIPYSGELSPRSVNEPMTYGFHKDGAPAQAELRQHSGLIVGQKGSGKTNLLHVVTGENGRAVDTLVWHIDLNGGGMSQPWLHAWLEGQTGRPAIDWAACTIEDAQVMVDAAIRIAKDRKRSYRKLKIQANSNLLPVSSALPEILIMLDEGAEVMNPRHQPKSPKGKLRDGLEEVIRIARNEGVNVVLSSLRATQGLISRDVITQCAWAVGMLVSDPAELTYLFGMTAQMYRAIDPEELAGPGCAFGRDGTTTPRALKVAEINPAQIVAASLEISRRRPELDEASARVAGHAYATRYQRMRAAFADLGDQDEDFDGYQHGQEHGGQGAEIAPVVPMRRQPYSQPRAAHPVPRPAAPVAQVTGSASAWPAPHELLRNRAAAASGERVSRAAAWPDPPRPRRLHAEQTTAPGDGHGAAQRPQLDQLPAAPARPVPQILRRALEVFDAARTTRLHSEELAAALGILAVDHDGERGDVLALAALLRPLGVAPLPNPFSRGGQRGRGYERGDLVAVAQRIARGEIDVPREVANWATA